MRLYSKIYLYLTIRFIFELFFILDDIAISYSTLFFNYINIFYLFRLADTITLILIVIFNFLSIRWIILRPRSLCRSGTQGAEVRMGTSPKIFEIIAVWGWETVKILEG